ncbi:unnamed protein product [Blumeria hordei]|uniref:Uncharacterized protein n=1 Tax=Blumeria hordei TaxID=2867405 RepID=A0A383ULR7_BLUHO|nr:unnamed protein product [Blumeria hordei]
MQNHEFKGLTNISDKGMKCVTVWDLSSAPLDTIYSPSSILHMEKIPHTYWPEACVGYKFKYKTIWLYIELVLKTWSEIGDSKKLNFPIVNYAGFLFWPLRLPETHTRGLTYAFAIGYHIRLNDYGLYIADLREGVLSNYRRCLNLPRDDIRSLQGKLSPDL